MPDKEKEKKAVDDNQKKYRDYFEIVDKYLIGIQWDPTDEAGDGYIVFIDYQNDLDYIDNRDLEEVERKEQNRWIAKLQYAEAAQCKHLPESQQMDFKRMLGAGYIHALNGNYEGIEQIIEDASSYLKKRNREYSRALFLKTGLPAAVIAGIIGIILYFEDYRNPWIFGILFGVLGSFVSIWTRYGKLRFTGQAHLWLHIFECYSRMLIGTVFSVIAMISIKSELIFPQISKIEYLYSFILAAFIASFSERFIPSIIEQITKDKNDGN